MDAQGHVSREEVRVALRAVYRGDPESDLQDALRHWLADDLRPVDQKGRWRPRPLLIVVALVMCALIAVFFYFTLGGTNEPIL